jgi:hypothetical protein
MSVADIGLLSINLDGNDYLLWETIQTIRTIICIREYNAVFGDVYPICIPDDSKLTAQMPNITTCITVLRL